MSYSVASCLAGIDIGEYELFVSVDGPRPDVFSDIALVDQSVEEFQRGILGKNYRINRSSTNKGVKNAVIDAIDWCFEFVDALIIIEDDLNFDRSMIDFLVYALSAHNCNPKIWSVNCNRVGVYDSPVLTKYSHCWGWATWKDRWEQFDIGSINVDASIKNAVATYGGGLLFEKYWRSMWEMQVSRRINSWNIPWVFKMWELGRYSLSPPCNIVVNASVSGAHGTGSIKNALLFSGDVSCGQYLVGYDDGSLVYDDRSVKEDVLKDRVMFGISFKGFLLSFGYSVL